MDPSLLDRAFQSLAQRFDGGWGGLAGAPKFPQPLMLEFALRTWKRTGDADALRFVEVTLRRMAAGGMYDHLGGGFARYSVDAHWLVPHFEKMLYDNALLVRVYLHAWQATGSPEYLAVAEDVLRWVTNEMTSPEGGFHSALDADSEGEEGLFYLWTPEQIDELLGPEDGAIVRAWWGVTPEGNFEGRTILHAWRSVEAAAAGGGRHAGAADGGRHPRAAHPLRGASRARVARAGRQGPHGVERDDAARLRGSRPRHGKRGVPADRHPQRGVPAGQPAGGRAADAHVQGGPRQDLCLSGGPRAAGGCARRALRSHLRRAVAARSAVARGRGARALLGRRGGPVLRHGGGRGDARRAPPRPVGQRDALRHLLRP